jgi:hypothetical protein
MNAFGIVIFKGKNNNPWINEQPFETMDRIVNEIYSLQIDDPNDIKSILWIDEFERWSDVTEKIAKFVWEIYDCNDEYCYINTIKWFQTFGLPVDHFDVR